MEELQRPPPLKRQITLKLSNIPSSSSANNTANTPTTPQTPSQGPPKIKLIRKSLPSTPIDAKPMPLPKLSTIMPPPPPPHNGESSSTRAAPSSSVKTKFGRTMKPSSKRRAEEDVNGAHDGRVVSRGAGGPLKKIKLTTATTPKPVPNIKVKSKTTGKIPYRPPGDGYDSEAEDREIDPTIEEQFVLRMLPGEHCEYIRKCIEERKFGLSRKEGGADFQMKWLDEETRRAIVTVLGQPFAAVLVDLPTITESNKTWDKKALVKSADICQMLLVFAPVTSEEEAKTAPLPKPVEPGYRWPHGLTPPMHDCRHRRFRKRLSKLEIQNKEAEVERLLAADKAAISTTIEWVDEDDTGVPITNGEVIEFEEEGEEDADGEFDDYFGDAEVEQQAANGEDIDFDDALLEAEFEEAPDTPADDFGLVSAPQTMDAPTPATANTGTPAAHTEESGAEVDAAEEESGEDEVDEEEEEEDDEGDEGNVGDDGDEDNRDEVAGVRLEIATLKKQLAKCEEDLAKSNAPIMRRRLEDRIRNIKAEIQLKKSSINEIDDD